MSAIVDLIQPITTANHPVAGRCRLRAYRPREGVLVAIFTELEDNPGPSVTNAIAELATDIRRGQMRQGEALLVIEHYAYDGQFHLNRDGDYALVQMSWEAERRRYSTPAWSYRTKQQIEALIGEGL